MYRGDQHEGIQTGKNYFYRGDYSGSELVCCIEDNGGHSRENVKHIFKSLNC